MNKDTFEDKRRDTIFNIALLSLERLNNLFEECNQYSSMCYYNGHNTKFLQLWKDKISAIYREISPKMSKKHKSEVQKLWKMLNETEGVLYSKNTEEGKKFFVNIKNFNRKWAILHKMEVLLRTIADQRGMLVPDKPDEMAATEL